MNPNFNNNQMLEMYKRMLRNNQPFQNNPLLRNNTAFNNDINFADSQRMAQIRELNKQKMERLHQIRNMKQSDNIDLLNRLKSKNKITDLIIRPEKIKRENSKVLDDQLFKKQKEYNNNEKFKKDLWKSRDNEKLYKPVVYNVLSEKDKKKHYKKNYDRKNKDELVIHKVSKKDKDKKKLKGQLTKLQNELETHDGELKVVYGSDKEFDHKKKFEYDHVVKFRGVKYKASDHHKLKNVDLYKREQKKFEKGVKKKDQILNDVMESEILNDELIDKIKEDQKDEDEIENQIMKKLGKEKEDSDDESEDDNEESVIQRNKPVEVKYRFGGETLSDESDSDDENSKESKESDDENSIDLDDFNEDDIDKLNPDQLKKLWKKYKK